MATCEVCKMALHLDWILSHSKQGCATVAFLAFIEPVQSWPAQLRTACWIWLCASHDGPQLQQTGHC